MIYVYQVADVPIRSYTMQKANMAITTFDSHATSAPVNGLATLFGDKLYMTSNPYHHDAGSYNLEGLLYNSNEFSVAEFVGKLQEYVGQTVDVISYMHYTGTSSRYFDPLRSDEKTFDPEETCNEDVDCNNGLIWFHTKAVIKKVSTTHRRMLPHSCRIELQFGNRYVPLDTLNWEWRESIHRNAVRELIRSYDSPYGFAKPFPMFNDLINIDSCPGLFHRRVFVDDAKLIWYDPQAWEVWANGCTYYNIGHTETSKVGRYTYSVTPKPTGIFSAPPMSMYHITGLTTTLPFKIEIQRKSGTWEVEDDTLVLDIVRTNERLVELGLSAITSTDEIVFGDVPYLDGFILRNGSILTIDGENVFRVLLTGSDTSTLTYTYTGFTAGQLHPSFNMITTYPPNRDAKYSAIHLYRRAL